MYTQRKYSLLNIGRSSPIRRWYLDEEYWRDSYTFVFADHVLTSASLEIDWILSKCELNGTSCLDLCCGNGRHAAELARRGYRTVAVDSSNYLISQAKILTEGLGVMFLRKNLEVDFPFRDFNLVLNLNSSFGQFSSDSSNRQFLVNMARAVSHGGYLIINCLTKEIISRGYRRRELYRTHDGIACCERRRNRDYSIIRSTWRFMKGRHESTYHLKYYVYDPSWFIKVLNENGFAEIDCYGGFDGQKYDISANEIVLVCKKNNGG